MNTKLTRRSLFRRSVAVAAPLIVPASVLGRLGAAAPAPSGRIRLGLVGLGSMGLALGLRASGREATSNFVGQWAPTLLILGVYNKIVKAVGSDRFDQGRFR